MKLGRDFFPVALTYFIDTFGLAIIYPIFTPFFLKGQHSPFVKGTIFEKTVVLGLLIASFPLFQSIGAPIIGGLSDRYGRKKIFIVTVLGGALGYFFTGVGIHVKFLPLLWGGRIISGLFAGNLTLCLAAIADRSHTHEERGVNFGKIASLGGLGFVLGIMTGSAFSNPDLSPNFRPEIPFFIACFFSLINLIFLLWLFVEVNHHQSSNRFSMGHMLKMIGKAIRKKQTLTIYFVYFLFCLCWIPSLQFLSAYLIDVYRVSINTITLTFCSIALTWAVANFLLNRLLLTHLKPVKIFSFGLLSLAIFLYLTLIPKEPLALFLIHFLIATLAAALSWTNGLAAISLNASKTIQGTTLGVSQSITSLATIIGPLLGSLVAGLDIHKFFGFTATMSLLATLLLFIRPFGIRKS